MTMDATNWIRSHASSIPTLSGLPLFLLIDPYFGEPASLDIDPQSATTFAALVGMRKAAWQGRHVEVATHNTPVIEPRSLPYLVAMEGSDDPVFTTALQMAQSERDEAMDSGQGVARIGAVLETALPPDRVMDRLQRMWAVSTTGARRYLRFSDARVFELLTHLFHHQALQAWLGPIAQWHYLSRNGHWQAFNGAAAEALIQSEASMYARAQHLEMLASSPARLPWTSEQLSRLNESQLLSRALTQLQRLGKPMDVAYHAQGWAAIAKGRQCGLTHPDDLVAYTWRSLIDPGFATQPAALVALASAQARPGSLDAVLTPIKPHDASQEQRP